MAGKRAETLLELMFFVKQYTLDRAWTGLTDDEFFWEPTPNTWSVRPVTETRTPTPWVSGDWEADYDAPLAMSVDWQRDGEPLTNIAWLFWHVGSMPGRTAQLDFLGGDHTAASGWASPYFSQHPIFTSADDAITTMRAGWRALVHALRDATDDQLERTMPTWGWAANDASTTASQIVASVVNEVSHHATQICVLRDFYRAR